MRPLRPKFARFLRRPLNPRLADDERDAEVVLAHVERMCAWTWSSRVRPHFAAPTGTHVASLEGAWVPTARVWAVRLAVLRNAANLASQVQFFHALGIGAFFAGLTLAVSSSGVFHSVVLLGARDDDAATDVIVSAWGIGWGLVIVAAGLVSLVLEGMIARRSDAWARWGRVMDATRGGSAGQS